MKEEKLKQTTFNSKTYNKNVNEFYRDIEQLCSTTIPEKKKNDYVKLLKTITRKLSKSVKQLKDTYTNIEWVSRRNRQGGKINISSEIKLSERQTEMLESWMKYFELEDKQLTLLLCADMKNEIGYAYALEGKDSFIFPAIHKKELKQKEFDKIFIAINPKSKLPLEDIFVYLLLHIIKPEWYWREEKLRNKTNKLLNKKIFKL